MKYKYIHFPSDKFTEKDVDKKINRLAKKGWGVHKMSGYVGGVRFILSKRAK